MQFFLKFKQTVPVIDTQELSRLISMIANSKEAIIKCVIPVVVGGSNVGEIITISVTVEVDSAIKVSPIGIVTDIATGILTQEIGEFITCTAPTITHNHEQLHQDMEGDSLNMMFKPNGNVNHDYGSLNRAPSLRLGDTPTVKIEALKTLKLRKDFKHDANKNHHKKTIIANQTSVTYSKMLSQLPNACISKLVNEDGYTLAQAYKLIEELKTNNTYCERLYHIMVDVIKEKTITACVGNRSYRVTSIIKPD
jgi:hypothetical protein